LTLPIQVLYAASANSKALAAYDGTKLLIVFSVYLYRQQQSIGPLTFRFVVTGYVVWKQNYPLIVLYPLVCQSTKTKRITRSKINVHLTTQRKPAIEKRKEVIQSKFQPKQTSKRYLHMATIIEPKTISRNSHFYFVLDLN
jgi:hypothetical protein